MSLVTSLALSLAPLVVVADAQPAAAAPSTSAPVVSSSATASTTAPNAANAAHALPAGTIALTPEAIAFKEGPPSLPKGAKAALLEGDPTKPGVVTMRLTILPGWRLPMHTHQADERVTVLKGAMRVTYVETKDDGTPHTTTRTFPAGSFYVTPKGVAHIIDVDEETTIQITVQGPWTVDYTNPKDDPRAKK